MVKLIIAELDVTPLGTAETGLSDYVAKCHSNYHYDDRIIHIFMG